MRHLFFLLLVAVAAMTWTGCASWRAPSRPDVPRQIRESPYDVQLIDPATRQEAYARLFPPQPSLQATGDLKIDAGRWWWRFKLLLNFHYAAPDRNRVRLKGLLPGPTSPTLFDLIVNDGEMAVELYAGGGSGCFLGPIPEDGSPLGRQLGIEPWELIDVFTIGQRIAAGSFHEKRGSKIVKLYPQPKTSADGLRRVDLDAQSGLPSRAWWKKPNGKWEARYLEWGFFHDKKSSGPARLMPRRLEIHRGWPRVTLRVQVADDQYRFNLSQDHVDRLMRWKIDRRWRVYPLDQLGKVLTD